MNFEEAEERFTCLEIAAAEHERIIKDLNQIVTEQALLIDVLKKQVMYLVKNYDDSGRVKPLSEEVPPPHY